MINRKILYIAMGVFAAAFLWSLFFTWGFPFCWEDFAFFHLDKEEYSMPVDFSARFTSGIAVLGKFARDFFAPHRLFQIGFSCNDIDRPYLFHTAELLGILFGDHVIFYRIVKSFVFSINACIIFLLISRLSVMVAIPAALIYITSSEMWVSLAYNCDVGIYTQLTMLVSILLFIRMLSAGDRLKKKDLWWHYAIILFASNYAVLSRSDGRYLAILFIITLIVFRIRDLKYHAPMLIVLLLVQLPVLGYIKKFITGSPAFPIDLASHNDRSAFEALKTIFSNLQYPGNALGGVLLILLSVLILIHLVSVIFRKKARLFSDDAGIKSGIKAQFFIFTLWFIFSFAMISISRSYAYSGPYDWVVSEQTFFLIPFIIFMSYFAYLVSSRLKMPFQRTFILFCALLMFGQVILNLPRINRFRGGWGNYFCAWKNVEKYVDARSDNAMVYTSTEMFYKPFVFGRSNNKVINNLPGAHNLGFMEKAFETEGFSDIYLARRFGVEAEGSSDKVILRERAIIDGDTGDLYDRMKLLIGVRSCPVIVVERYIYNKGDLKE
ncbi:MAG: hypothetical protein PHS64_02560 [Candidatus Omnitrophica bacterium]|nr:hypothetical protein [Candidatus Omnitrophota bacterium]